MSNSSITYRDRIRERKGHKKKRQRDRDGQRSRDRETEQETSNPFILLYLGEPVHRCLRFSPQLLVKDALS